MNDRHDSIGVKVGQDSCLNNNGVFTQSQEKLIEDVWVAFGKRSQAFLNKDHKPLNQTKGLPQHSGGERRVFTNHAETLPFSLLNFIKKLWRKIWKIVNTN
jgi:hypothetical protein